MHLSNSSKPSSEHTCVSFAGFRLEDDGTLLRGEQRIHLPPKELAALRLLLANAGHIVTPLQLRQALWGDVHVTADSVPRCMSSLRARLEPEDCIQTVYKRGYRLTSEVHRHGGGPGGNLPRLAILPFAAGYGVPAHLGPALAEETMARLSAARPALVFVLAQDSVFTLARKGMTAHQTGEALGADLVLIGSLRALPAHFRVRTEMIRVENGTQVWVEDMLVDRDRIAGMETELVNRLAFRLHSGIPGDGSWRVGRNTESPTDRSLPAGWNAGFPGHLPLLNGVQASAALSGREKEGLSISAVAASEQENSVQQREAYEIFQRARHEWQTLERHRMQDG